MKFLLAIMRMFHHMMGITPPRPEQERKILMLWFITFLVFILVAAAFVLLIAPRLLR